VAVDAAVTVAAVVAAVGATKFCHGW